MRRWFALPLLCLAVPALAQDAPVPAPPPPTLADQLTFGENEARMTVPVQIAGAGPYQFIIDTGAQRTVISRELARTLGLAAGRGVRVTAMTGSSDVDTVLIPSITVSTLGGTRIDAPALAGRDLGAPGMLGIDTLQGHALAIDFVSQTMAVTPSKRRPRREVAHRPDEIVIYAKSLFGQLVVTDAYVGNQRVRVILDTGSVVSMGNGALRRRLRSRPGAPIELVSVLGASMTADYTVIDTIKLGDLSMNNLPIAFADAPPFARFGLADKPAILLGMDALKLFRSVRIDFANRELRLALPRDVHRAS